VGASRLRVIEAADSIASSLLSATGLYFESKKLLFRGSFWPSLMGLFYGKCFVRPLLSPNHLGHSFRTTSQSLFNIFKKKYFQIMRLQKLLQMWAAMYWFSVYGACVKKNNEILFEHRCKKLLKIEQEKGFLCES